MKVEPSSTWVMVGDSITACQRVVPDSPEGLPEDLGKGYVSLVHGLLTACYPSHRVRMINRGVPGDTVRELKGRWQSDVLDLKPDWLSVCIGINDVWQQLDAQQSGWKAFIRADEVAALYEGHEVCSHTVDHPRMWSVPVDQLRWEILEDRRRLEALVGYPVRGFVIPYSWATGYDWSLEFLRNCGFKYMRHTVNIPEFEHPADFMDWHPTAHCSADLSKLWASMLQRSIDQPGQLFYLWGHSYEFEDDWGWEVIESFARLASDTEGVYHATKGKIYDYVTAWRALDWSLDGTLVRNNSAMPLWFLRNGQAVKIERGHLLRLEDQ